ncbi:MAG: hypothetical protein QOE11_3612 [Solirubrobacteraceae bacterium]|jgi:hypothetical protein|nr:hypothetical protein [Solirubrobacteraceae bacterium]
MAVTRILFTGYAPVHFACFRPLYQALLAQPGVDVAVSGGLRSRAADDLPWSYDADAMYRPFKLSSASILTVEQIERREFDVLFCANTKPIRPASHGRAIQIFHGLSFRNRSLRARNLEYDHCFTVGPYMMRRLAELGPGADDRTLVPIGFPKTDRLLDGSIDRDAIRRSLGFDGSRPVLLYAPTGAHDNSLETMGEELLARLAEQDRYDVLVKPHDHPKKPIDWFARLAALEDEHLRVTREPDVIPLMVASDLLISDASSVATEYTLLDRPIVFLDVPELLAAAAADDDRLDMATWGRRGGRVAADCEAALEAIAGELADPDQALGDVRRALRDDCFFNPGAATGAALTWMGDHVLT